MTAKSKVFTPSDRDNALFEAGIKLGSLYHQFVGSPLSLSGITSMETAVQDSMSAQP
ncbi:MAG: dihydroneopterin aldolase family protein, partial [Methanimicrococcus sp.]|nr:dihydroneopterin aldolase family protein [Methanimicrococcus sp.]